MNHEELEDREEAAAGFAIFRAEPLTSCEWFIVQVTSEVTRVTFQRITVDAQQMGGVPCIRGLRIPVSTVVSMIADRLSPDEILSLYPDLEREDIAEALRYAAEALKERSLPLV